MYLPEAGDSYEDAGEAGCSSTGGKNNLDSTGPHDLDLKGVEPA